MTYFLPGYTGVVWTALKAGLAYTSATLDPTAPQAQLALVEAMANSLKNGLTAIEANQFYQASQVNFTNLAPLPALDLSPVLSSTVLAFMNARVTALQAAVLSIASLSTLPVPQILVAPVANIPQTLQAGLPIIPDALAPYPDWVGWLLACSNKWTSPGFHTTRFEAPPPGLTTRNFVAQAQACAAAWPAIAAALQTGGFMYTGSTLNAVNQMGLVAQVVADELGNATQLSAATNLSDAWNQLVAMPTLTRFASLVYNDPTSLASQNTSTIRYVILRLMVGLNKLVVALRQNTQGKVALVTVRQNDNLMDIAARSLGNYELWYQIAQINGLVPPFVSNSPAPGVASPGQQLFLPTPTTTTAFLGSAPNYLINYLGVDLFYGPLNADMLPWTGDFNLVSGYQNLTFSLGRRLQTTLGTLIYHPAFGSRIPPQIGSIGSANENKLIQSFTESALRGDPRVNKIVAISVVAQPNYLVAVTSTVLPNGIGVQSVTVNEVLGP